MTADNDLESKVSELEELAIESFFRADGSTEAMAVWEVLEELIKPKETKND